MEKAIKETFDIAQIDPGQYSPLALAYMGDCAYELVIRTLLLHKGNAPVDRLNRKASRLAKAETQAKIIMELQDELTEEEMTMYKRGRNAKSYTSAKNASINDYRKATGLEALLGWLYLKGDFERMMQLIRLGFEAIDADIIKTAESEDKRQKTETDSTPEVTAQ